MGGVRSVTDRDFAEQVLAAPGPVLVEFTAEWCPPCRQLAPVLAELAVEQEGRLAVVALDVDANPETRNAYGVLSMPTLMVFRDGEPVRSLVGARAKSRLLRELDDLL
ncbi:thioredoxin family protein [Kitasatospora fiedleri]|uniref:thioredoxin family protein n=1 Tax=Kitasatospora fiedleri TaxID=2991545 RepID=UPI00249BCAEB|nr:thioredoxin domain-containing protein [Kitasatospora fiedleri]